MSLLPSFVPSCARERKRKMKMKRADVAYQESGMATVAQRPQLPSCPSIFIEAKTWIISHLRFGTVAAILRLGYESAYVIEIWVSRKEEETVDG